MNVHVEEATGAIAIVRVSATGDTPPSPGPTAVAGRVGPFAFLTLWGAARVSRIDTARRQVELARGAEPVGHDLLVNSLGSHADLDAVPGAARRPRRRELSG